MSALRSTPHIVNPAQYLQIATFFLQRVMLGVFFFARVDCFQIMFELKNTIDQSRKTFKFTSYDFYTVLANFILEHEVQTVENKYLII